MKSERFSICRIVSSLPYQKDYGLFVSFSKLSKYQKDIGNDVITLAGGRHRGPTYIGDNVVFCIPHSQKFGSYLSLQARIRSAVKELDKSMSFDVIHSHGRSALFLTRFKVNKPHLIQIHGLPYLAIDPYLRKMCLSNRGIYRDFLYQYLYDLRVHLLYKFFLRSADAIAPVNSYLTKQIIDMYKVDQEKVHTVYQGVDATFKRVKDARHTICKNLRIPPESHLILFAGRLEFLKGVFSLIKSFKIIMRKINRDVRLLIIGSGRAEDQLIQAISSLGLSSKVHILHFIQHEKLPLYYSAADVTITPSLAMETSYVTLESLACGTPTITTDYEDNRLIFGGLAQYCLVNPYDVNDIAQKAIFLLGDSDLAMEIGQKVGANVRTKFTWKNCVEEYDHIYSLIT